jgi:hypothetical protein
MNSKIGKFYKTEINGIFLKDIRFLESPNEPLLPNETYIKLHFINKQNEEEETKDD